MRAKTGTRWSVSVRGIRGHALGRALSSMNARSYNFEVNGSSLSGDARGSSIEPLAAVSLRGGLP